MEFSEYICGSKIYILLDQRYYRMEARSRPSEFQVIIALDTDDGRLFPLTENSPLCLLKICNIPLLRLQLNSLEKFGATDVLIVAQEEYKVVITDALNDFTSDLMKVELIVIEELQGNADCLRHVAHRIRNDFIFITSDVILQYNIGDMINYHRINAADVTIGLAGCRVDEPEKKGGIRKVHIDEDDREYISMYTNGRILLKLPILEADTTLNLHRALLNKAHSLTVRSDLLDSGIYIFSKWIIDLLLQYTNILNIRSELLPFLIKHQYQPIDYIYNKIPILSKVNRRSRCGVDKWISMQENQTRVYENRVISIWQHSLSTPTTTVPVRRSMELCDYILSEMSETMPSSTFNSHSSNLNLTTTLSKKGHNSDLPGDENIGVCTDGTAGDHADGRMDSLECNNHIGDDVIRCYGYICPYSTNGVDGFLQRLTTVSSYLSLNR